MPLLGIGQVSPIPLEGLHHAGPGRLGHRGRQDHEDQVGCHPSLQSLCPNLGLGTGEGVSYLVLSPTERIELWCDLPLAGSNPDKP